MNTYNKVVFESICIFYFIFISGVETCIYFSMTTPVLPTHKCDYLHCAILQFSFIGTFCIYEKLIP